MPVQTTQRWQSDVGCSTHALAGLSLRSILQQARRLRNADHIAERYSDELRLSITTIPGSFGPTSVRSNVCMVGGDGLTFDAQWSFREETDDDRTFCRRSGGEQ